MANFNILTRFFGFILVAFTLHCSRIGVGASGDIYSVIVANGLTELQALIDTAGLAATLQGPGPFTVFAPSNQAIALGRDRNLLTSVNLKYHVVSGTVLSSQFVQNQQYPTITGHNVRFNAYDPVGISAINGVPLLTTDLIASNGVVHVINGILFAPSFATIEEYIQNDADLSTFSDFLSHLSKSEALPIYADPTQGLTVFAPTNAAWNRLGNSLINLQHFLPLHTVPNTIFLVGIPSDSSAISSSAGDLIVFNYTNNNCLFVAAPGNTWRNVGRNLKGGYSIDGTFENSCSRRRSDNHNNNNNNNDDKKEFMVPSIDAGLVIIPNILTGNGVVYKIDEVLVPIEYASSQGFSTFVSSSIISACLLFHFWF